MPQKKDTAPLRLFLVSVIFWLSQYAFSSYLNPEMERMGASATLMGLVGSLYGLAQVLARIPIGLLSERFGKQKFFVCMGCALAFLSCLGMHRFYSPMGFLVFRTLAGVGSATWVCFTVLYGAYFPNQDAPRRISLLDTSGHIGKLLGYGAVLVMSAYFARRAALTLGVILALGAFLLSLSVREQSAPAQHLHFRELRHIVANKHLLLCAGLAASAQFMQCGTCLSFTQNLGTRLHASNAQLVMLNIVLVCGAILLNLLANQVMIRRLGISRTVSVGFLMGAAYCVLAPLCQSVLALCLCQVLAGGVISVSLGVLLGQSMTGIETSQRPVAMAFFQSFFSIGMMLGPLCVGALADRFSLPFGFFVTGGLCVASALAAPALRKLSGSN